MLENLFRSGQATRDVVFKNPKGEFVRVSADRRTSLAKLIQERESLGEVVMTITDTLEAEKLVRAFEVFSQLGEVNDQIAGKR